MTLTQAAALVKQTITFSAIALVVTIAGFIGYKIWYAYYLAHLPKVEEKPDTKFGILPAINFPASAVSTSNFTYSVDTVTGGLPKVGVDPGFEKIIKVYFIPQTFATLLSSEKSQTLAEKFGIGSPPEVLTETKYRFKDQNKTLLVDLDTGNFSYTKEASPSGAITVDENTLISGFEQTLSNLEVFKEDLRSGRSKVTYLKANGEVAVARISLWPGPIDKKTIFTADSTRSPVTAVVYGSAGSLDNFLSLDFTYYPIDTTTFATYPIKTSEAAFDDLKNGKGVVLIAPSQPRVSLTALSLGYYLPSSYSPYLQPIFIFEGPQFMAYVPATAEQFQSQ